MQLKSYQPIPQTFRKARRGVHTVPFEFAFPHSLKRTWSTLSGISSEFRNKIFLLLSVSLQALPIIPVSFSRFLALDLQRGVCVEGTWPSPWTCLWFALEPEPAGGIVGTQTQRDTTRGLSCARRPLTHGYAGTSRAGLHSTTVQWTWEENPSWFPPIPVVE